MLNDPLFAVSSCCKLQRRNPNLIFQRLCFNLFLFSLRFKPIRKERGSMHNATLNVRTSVFARFLLHFSIILFTQSLWFFMNSIATEIMNKTMDQFCIVAFKLKSWTKLKFPNQKQFTNKIVVSSVVFKTQNEQKSQQLNCFHYRCFRRFPTTKFTIFWQFKSNAPFGRRLPTRFCRWLFQTIPFSRTIIISVW